MKKLLSITFIILSVVSFQVEANPGLSSIYKFLSLYTPANLAKKPNFRFFNVNSQFSPIRLFWTSGGMFSNLYSLQSNNFASSVRDIKTTDQSEEFISDEEKKEKADVFIRKALNVSEIAYYTYLRIDHNEDFPLNVAESGIYLSDREIDDLKRQIIEGNLQLASRNQKQFIAYHLETLCDSITWIKTLRLNGRNITTLPDNFVNLSKLRYLDLSDNMIKELPDNFNQLDRLEHINLSSNNLDVFPNDTCLPKTLKYLFMYNNKIETVPNHINQLCNLELIDLSSNGLKILPEEIGELSELNTLYLYSNDLRYIPNSIGNLSKLKILNLNYNNNLSIIPRSFLKLIQLHEVLLSGTKLGEKSEMNNHFYDMHKSDYINYDDLKENFNESIVWNNCFYAKKE
ncbi:MAG: leucine-rich repeat domain-containing protein [Alphaproteobacteria bacterium]|nr:leucine-rich repeat domain-containing protein [Alphaproteobacteria bacterium]